MKSWNNHDITRISVTSQQEIFYVLNSRWPTIKAYGLQMAKTCQGLKRSGAEIRLIIPMRARHRELKGMNPFTLYGIHDRFRITRLPSLDFARLYLNHPALFFLQQALFAVLVALYLLPKRGVVYTRDPYIAYLLSFMRRNVFWEAHRFPNRPDSHTYRRLMQHTAGIVVITEGLRESFRRHGAPAERIVVIADAVDSEEFAVTQTPQEARKELGLPMNGPIIGYVGQLTTMGKEKGMGDLLRAFTRLHQRHPDASLVVVGGSPEDLRRYRSEADTLGSAGRRVVWAGQQPHRNIPLYLRAMDVLAMPFPNTEHYAHFMSPLKLFEYLAAQKPIVATDLPSVREIVSDDEVFFVRPDDPQALAEGLATAITDPVLVERKIQAVNRILPRHSWRGRGQHILAFIAACTAH